MTSLRLLLSPVVAGCGNHAEFAKEDITMHGTTASGRNEYDYGAQEFAFRDFAIILETEDSLEFTFGEERPVPQAGDTGAVTPEIIRRTGTPARRTAPCRSA